MFLCAYDHEWERKKSFPKGTTNKLTNGFNLDEYLYLKKIKSFPRLRSLRQIEQDVYAIAACIQCNNKLRGDCMDNVIQCPMSVRHLECCLWLSMSENVFERIEGGTGGVGIDVPVGRSSV